MLSLKRHKHKNTHPLQWGLSYLKFMERPFCYTLKKKKNYANTVEMRKCVSLVLGLVT